MIITLSFDEEIDDVEPLRERGEMQDGGAIVGRRFRFGATRDQEFDDLERTLLSLAGVHQRSSTSGISHVQIHVFNEKRIFEFRKSTKRTIESLKS